MRGKLGITLMCLGTVLLAAALSLFLYNSGEAKKAQASAQALLPQIREKIGELGSEPGGEIRPVVLPGTPAELIGQDALEMTEVEIDGYWYIGYLAVPELELELPVMSDWSYEQLRIAPCRYRGSVLTEDLVLMAHNYPSHFGKVKSVPVGTRMTFTDMDGRVTEYEVLAIEVLAPTAVEDVTAGEFDLTLFTCTYDGKNRVTIRCDRVKGG